MPLSHELHARCGQVFALLLDALVDGHSSDRRKEALTAMTRSPETRPPDVVKAGFWQLNGGRLRVARLTLLVHRRISRSRGPSSV